MDRHREARRGVTIAVSNGLSRRRHRSNSLRDSPVEEDGILEFQETARLRDRKKDRDRDRDRDRERERDREKERDRLSRSSKRRRSDMFINGSMREDGGDDTSEDSVNDGEDDEDGGGGGGNSSSMRMLPPNPSSSSSSMLNHHNSNHHHHHHNSNNHNSSIINNNINNHSRKTFPPPTKVFRATPPSSVTSTTTATTTTSTWKAADEMIGVSVPRKARSASTKRSHEWASSGGGGGVVAGVVGEQIHRQESTSPVRLSVPTVMVSPAQASPSSSVTVRKKMKPNGPKLKPPKSSSNKSSSSAQDEIEIEIAEVLYGMMRQPQGPSKQEIMGADSVSREVNNNNKTRTDAKSRVSSPISNSPPTLPQPSSILLRNSSSSTAPVSTIAPKRKKPRPVKYDDDNPSMFTVSCSPISAYTKAGMDQSAKIEASANLEKISATAAAENGSISYDLGRSQVSAPQQEAAKPEINPLFADSKGLTEESESGRRDLSTAKEESQSPKKESTASLRLDDDRRDNKAVTKANSTPSEDEIPREEKFQIDLMAPPPLRSSPERDGETEFVAVDLQPGQKPAVKENEKDVKTIIDDANVEVEENKAKTVAEESESLKPVVGEERNIDLQIDLEKSDRDSGTGTGNLTDNKLHQHVQKQQQQQPPVPETTAQSNSLPIPLSMGSWSDGLPPMGYMAPLHGVVSVDGIAVSSAAVQHPHLLFSQPRPKKCATHCYIARNIHYHQQFTKINPFWPAAAGSASLHGAKAACNLNVVPPKEIHGTFPGRGVNTVPDKGQDQAIFPSHAGKDSKSSHPATIMDGSQRKQVLLQQALPPGTSSNILFQHASAFFFHLSQQQAASVARPGSVKSPPAASNAASSGASNSATVSATETAGAAAPAMSLNYPNMLGNENQYLAILPSNGYPFPISAHVGAPPAYIGTHAQAMPFFNGPFYSSQMLHPCQQQQQQQQHQPLPTQSQQSQRGHQNTGISSGSSSPQKHLQNQQQRPHSSGINGGSSTLQGYPTPKNQDQLQLQQRQQQNQEVPHQACQLESEMGGKESPSTPDSRVSRVSMNMYGQNFAMPLHSPNFDLMTTAPASTSEKKPQQQQSSKFGVESLTSQNFAMTFASINGPATAPGFDFSSIAQNPALLQSFPEVVRHEYQIMAAAWAAQQKKNYSVFEDGKTGGNDASNVDEERKSTSRKPPATVGQFSRQDLTDAHVSAMTGNTVFDSSTRTLNLGSVSARSNVSVMPASVSNANTSAAQQQLQQSQHQHQQMMQLQKQQQFAAAAAAAQRSKIPGTSNGSVYSDHLPKSSMAAKFPNALSVFSQNLVHSSSSPTQSPHWRNSGRTSTSQLTSQSFASSTTSSLKNLPQQQGRTLQGHTQISFAASPKSSSAQGQPPPSNNQSASPPMMVGSPTSSISKNSAGGSPRTTATTSTSNKGGQASLSSQEAKNSPSMPSQKSSPVPSILWNPNICSSSSTGGKQQMSQQQHQHLSKHAFQQTQLLFSNATYMQAQDAGSTTSSASAASGLFIQRHREQQPQHPGSSGMLSLCPPVTRSNSGTSDPAKAVAAASNMKGLCSQDLVHTGQYGATLSSGKRHPHVPPGFQYVTSVQVKPAEQKQTAGE